MYIFQWTGNSGKTYLLKNISYATLTDVFKLCSICPISAVDVHDYQIHNSLHTLLHFVSQSTHAKVTKQTNVTSRSVASQSIILRDSHRFFDAAALPLLFPQDNAFDLTSITIDGRNMIIYRGRQSGALFTTIATNLQFDPYWYQISGLPYVMIGEGGYSTSIEYYKVNKSAIVNVTDKVPWFHPGRNAYINTPLRTQYPFLFISSGLIDSLSQVVFESDANSGSLAKGLSKELITTFASTNMLRPICAYAPVMKNIENDPLNQIDVRGYTCGQLYVPRPFTRSVNVQEYGLYSTSRSPVTLGSPEVINQDKRGVVNRDLIMPIFHDGVSYGFDSCYDHKARRVYRLTTQQARQLVKQVSDLRLYRIDDGSDVNRSYFKVVQL